MPESPRQDCSPPEREEGAFRLLVESVTDYELIMLDPEGYVVSWNSGAARIKGYEPAEIIGSHFSRFYPPEDVAAGKPARELAQAVAEGRVEDEDWRVRRDGTRFWANVVITALHDPETGALRGFGKVTRDLTERKLAEEKLRQSEEQFRLLVERVDEYAIFMLDTTGKVMTWNLGAQQAKGYRAEEIIGQSFERFYPAEEQAQGKPFRLLELARTTGHARDQGIRVRKDGSTFQADVLITAIYDVQGALRGYAKLTRDISDQIRNAEMEAARFAAEKASEAKDEFLAILSHELRTPLTPVLAAASYLAENAAQLSSDEVLEEVRIIRRNVQLEARLIDDLLDLTRISRGKVELRLQAVDAHESIHQALEICLEDSSAKGLSVQAMLEAPEHWVWADPTRLGQIIWNLVNNAVKFTPAGGSVTVRSFVAAPGQLTIEVKDTGPGIAPELAGRIFNAFEQGERTVTRQFGGLGLGLAITRNLVNQHGGTVGVFSAGLGHGATFHVTLPLTAALLAAPALAAPGPPPLKASWRILLVDDHEDTRRVMARLLTKLGHVVETSSSVKAALRVLPEAPYDVLISDIGLPDGSGYDLMEGARRQHPKLTGIAISGFGMEEDKRRSSEAGFSYHLNKPVDFGALRDLLQGLGASEGEAVRP